MLLSPGSTQIDKHIMNLCGVEDIIMMYNYIVSVYRKNGHSNQTRITMKSIFASLESYVKSIVRNMKLSFDRIAGSPHKSAFLHAFGIYELIIEQLKSENFHELSNEAVSQKKAFKSATTPFPHPTTVYFDSDMESDGWGTPPDDEDDANAPPPDGADDPPPDASAAASYTEIGRAHV